MSKNTSPERFILNYVFFKTWLYSTTSAMLEVYHTYNNCYISNRIINLVFFLFSGLQKHTNQSVIKQNAFFPSWVNLIVAGVWCSLWGSSVLESLRRVGRNHLRGRRSGCRWLSEGRGMGRINMNIWINQWGELTSRQTPSNFRPHHLNVYPNIMQTI